MQAVVTHPGTIEEALSAGDATRWADPHEIHSVVSPSHSLDAVQRVEIYHGMYMMRMIESIAADYPALQQHLGESAFESLIGDYVLSHPSTSYTLNRLGDELPAFIKTSTIPRKIFCYDLARLELAMTQVFDEEERAPLASDSIGSIAPEDLERVRFVPIPALRLHEFSYDANSSFQAHREGAPIVPRRVRSWLVIHRRDYSVYRMPLERPAFTLLEGLVQGKSLGEALASFQRRLRRFPDQMDLFSWFRDWSAAGLFTSMSLPPRNDS